VSSVFWTYTNTSCTNPSYVTIEVMNRKIAFFTLSLIIFTEVLGFSLILPYLSFLARDLGLSAFEVGLLMSIFSLCQLFAAPIIGQLSDIKGRRTMLIISQASTVIGFFLLAIAKTPTILFLSRIVDGLFGSNMTLTKAYVTDITTKRERRVFFGKMEAINAVGLFIGPAVGGFLAKVNYSIPAFLATFVSTIAFVLTYFYLGETIKTKKDALVDLNRLFPVIKTEELLTNEAVKRLVIKYFLFIFSFTLISSNIGLYVQYKLNVGPENIGLLFLIVGGIRIIFQTLIYPRLIKKYSNKQIYCYGGIILGIAMLLMSAIVSVNSLYLMAILLAFGSSLTYPAIHIEIANRSDRRTRGLFNGITDSIGSLAQIIAPFLGGLLINLNLSLFIGVFAAVLIFYTLKL